MEDDPDSSTREIKHLLIKLNSRNGGGHKDRVRTLNRFRNYVAGTSVKSATPTTPEFYDDDLPLLLLGKHSPTALFDDPDTHGDVSNLCGILEACGTPSQDHTGGLKRSARNAMNLLKYLTVDYVELDSGKPIMPGIDAATGMPELNPFAYALCCLTVAQLRLAKFELHIKDLQYNSSEGNKRSGAKEDACNIVVLLFTRHLSNDGTQREPLNPEELLPTVSARKSFESWLVQNTSKEVQNAVKAAMQEGSGGSGNVNSGANVNLEGGANNVNVDDGDGADDILNAFSKKKKREMTEEEEKAVAEAEAHAEEQLDELGLKLYSKTEAGDSGPIIKWTDSQLAKQEIKLSADAAARESEREKNESDAEKARQIAERQKMIGRDPLGIRSEEFDIRTVQANARWVIEQAIQDLEEEMAVMGDNDRGKKENTFEQLVSLKAQRDALEAILDGHRVNRSEDGNNKRSTRGEETKNVGAIEDLSILPTDPNFDPLLFLSLVHRDANFEQLQSSISRLSNKTENQVQQLQNLVLENFALFLRCADGIDLFSEQSDQNKNRGIGVKDRLDLLDLLSQSCSNQARKSFKPLLDNTNEVRKVQSALAVLQRIGPLLQVPNLMRQHIENGRFSAAVKAYRSVSVIEDDNKIELLANVKFKAAEAARDARRDLECRLANPSVPVQTILDGIRDLGELIELDIPTDSKNNDSKNDFIPPESLLFVGVSSPAIGKFKIGNVTINVRAYPPCLGCLLMQAAHFALLVEKALAQTETAANRIYAGETLSAVTDEGDVQDANGSEHTSTTAPSTSAESKLSKASSDKRERNRWKYDILEARVVATIRAVSIARTWLPRLLRIGTAARESEKRRAARAGMRKPPYIEVPGEKQTLSTFEVFITNISPAVTMLVEHATFCALGCYNSTEGQELKMSFGFASEERLQTLLRAPLPSLQSTKCATELADLFDVVQNVAASVISLRPSEDDIDGGRGPGTTSTHFHRIAMESPMEECTALAEEGLVTLERRRCIYAFDQCAKTCSMWASGSCMFDGDALLTCVQKLSEELTRPEESSHEIEKGCELVVRRCCEGLASYVRDRGDAARLRAVSECATAMVGRIVDVVREVAYLTNGQCISLEEALMDDVMALEGVMFDEFLDNIRRNISAYTRLGPPTMVSHEDEEAFANGKKPDAVFPAYLSASLLAIVRCRAQVEKALGENTIRKSQSTTYQFLAMSTASDSVIDGICYELNDRMPRMRGSEADRYSNELQFLINTLRKYLSDDILNVAENCRRMLLSKAGGGFQGDGPDGLGAIEQLERLGRFYVLCLGE